MINSFNICFHITNTYYSVGIINFCFYIIRPDDVFFLCCNGKRFNLSLKCFTFYSYPVNLVSIFASLTLEGSIKILFFQFLSSCFCCFLLYLRFLFQLLAAVICLCSFKCTPRMLVLLHLRNPNCWRLLFFLLFWTHRVCRCNPTNVKPYS